VRSGSRGRWTYRYTPSYKGTYHFKITYAGSSTKYKAVSRTLHVAAK